MLKFASYFVAAALVVGLVGCVGNSDQNGAQFAGSYSGFWSNASFQAVSNGIEPLTMTVRSDGTVAGTFQNASSNLGQMNGSIDRAGNFTFEVNYGAGQPAEHITGILQVTGSITLTDLATGATLLTSNSSLTGNGSRVVGAAAPTTFYVVFGKQ